MHSVCGSLFSTSRSMVVDRPAHSDCTQRLPGDCIVGECDAFVGGVHSLAAAKCILQFSVFLKTLIINFNHHNSLTTLCLVDLLWLCHCSASLSTAAGLFSFCFASGRRRLPIRRCTAENAHRNHKSGPLIIISTN